MPDYPCLVKSLRYRYTIHVGTVVEVLAIMGCFQIVLRTLLYTLLPWLSCHSSCQVWTRLKLDKYPSTRVCFKASNNNQTHHDLKTPHVWSFGVQWSPGDLDLRNVSILDVKKHKPGTIKETFYSIFSDLCISTNGNGWPFFTQPCSTKIVLKILNPDSLLILNI